MIYKLEVESLNQEVSLLLEEIEVLKKVNEIRDNRINFLMREVATRKYNEELLNREGYELLLKVIEEFKAIDEAAFTRYQRETGTREGTLAPIMNQNMYMLRKMSELNADWQELVDQCNHASEVGSVDYYRFLLLSKTLHSNRLILKDTALRAPMHFVSTFNDGDFDNFF